jgi:hypothetical protein
MKESGDLEPILVEMLTSLISLRNSNWGHNLPDGGGPVANGTSAVVDSLPMPVPSLGTYELEPVFYAPDGQELTMEEYDFLQEYGVNDEDNFG